MRKYRFDWKLIGNIEEGRPNLGAQVDLDMYRLMQFTMRDTLEARYGTEAADEIFCAAGKLAGAEFYEHYIKPVESVDEFVGKTQQTLREKRVGVLRLEEAVMDEGRVTLTIDEDLDCSGLPELDYETCVYDEGFVSALFESFTKGKWKAEEIDCWCTGARTCRFLVTKEDLEAVAAK
jgi:predicted hydrocarbon binding protein